MKTSELDTLIKVDTIISSMDTAFPRGDSFINRPTFCKPKSKTVMTDETETSSSFNNAVDTARFYEINNGTIHESFSILENDVRPNSTIDEPNNQEKDIIVVLSDDMQKNELSEIADKFRNRLNLIVHYGSNNAIKSFFEHFSQIVSASSLKNAVNKSYLLAQNGQTIFFPRVNNRFDFFTNIDFV